MMYSFNRIAKSITKPVMYTIHSKIDDSWNDAWETAWLPDDISPKNRAPWEADVNFPSNEESTKMALSSDVDAETKAFVEDMNENWNERRKSPKQKQKEEAEKEGKGEGGGLYSLENIKKDYRLKKQRIHAGLWMKEIDKLEEAKLGDSADDIDRLLDSCSEILTLPMLTWRIQEFQALLS
ncbi:hypothetical protein ES319_A03G115700v1 [Gossypium barbadense]|uniref:Uncharacterized protein n=1 Tax=Gossypium barbadense TaxID=3634 RepID=A0A5J5WC76_GOSBA|nr:hypothetical protein ES319_A03G115700v1 [Gossypium barbadense]KAB2090314.1 hypothetical protein ES319_A03G115700v1 [Gossypium barbadense]